ncbi:MAG: InlB B-repeat-containing protein, partial [Muribaculaceae bacterium]|nr:InlB B-repeat-containing protein [Muribaculaceae bacterium]
AGRWGGALDEIDVNALANREGTAILTTSSLDNYKFNNVVAYGSDLYLPLASYASGAAVGRIALGSEEMTVLPVPGVSANAVSVDGSNLRVVTGYKGGVYYVDRSVDWIAEGDNATEVNELVAYSDNFGGKYIVGNSVLRTDAEAAALVNLADGSFVSLGAPLLSQEKYAENYDPETGDWTLVEGTQAAYYGKHTMAIDNDYIYVGGGLGGDGVNGLRVYDTAGTLKWQNGTTTTAVTVAGDFVFAATDAGLRVYKKYEEGKDLELFAFQVLNYNEDGTAAPGASGKPEAGIDANSCNFVAVDENYIYLAAGQQGVYVFELDATLTKETGFKTSTGIENIEEIEGEEGTFTVPTEPNVESWVDEKGTSYIPGTDVNITAGTVIVLDPVYKKYNVTFDLAGGEGEAPAQQIEYGSKVPVWPADPTKKDYDFTGWTVDGTPVNPADFTVTGDVTITANWKDHEYKYTLKFVGYAKYADDNTTLVINTEVENVPGELKSDNATFEIPDVTPVWGERKFWGWYPEVEWYDFDDPSVLKAGATFTIPEGQTEYTLYGVWSSKIEGGAGTEPVEPVVPDEPVIGGEDTNGKE